MQVNYDNLIIYYDNLLAFTTFQQFTCKNESSRRAAKDYFIPCSENWVLELHR